MTKISIVILAHNEENVIENTLNSLRRQSIFDKNKPDGVCIEEIIVVPNGCTDNTAGVASSVLEKKFAPYGKIVALSVASKSNAWNESVHSIVSSSADLIIFMDADIEFIETNTIDVLISYINDNEGADACSDVPVKDYRNIAKLTVFDSFSRRASQVRDVSEGMCGQLYCIRSRAARKIWLPEKLPVEDSFIGVMMVTDGFTVPARTGVVCKVVAVSHYYKPERSFRSFVRHEARIIVGSVINAWIFDEMWRLGQHGHVGKEIARLNSQDAMWVERVCAKQRAKGGWWLIPRSFLFWRFENARRVRGIAAIKATLIGAMATLAALPACVLANNILKRQDAKSVW